MKLIKLTALSSLFFVFVFGLSSCEKNAEKKKTTDYEKKGIIMSGAQEVPTNASTALGTMDVFYSKETRTLSYKVTWSGLTDSVSLMHIHGLAPSGFGAGVVQNIIIASTVLGTPGNGIFAQKSTANKYNFLKSGTISATLLADGVVVKENDLLNGNYYMNIHTPAYPGGEIRAQIRFQ